MPKFPFIYHETASDKSANGREYKSKRTAIVPLTTSNECKTASPANDVTTSPKSVDPGIGLDLSVPLELGEVTEPNPHPKKRRQPRSR